MIKYLYIILLVFSLSGCSLLKIASQPFKNTVSKVPESTQKLEKRVKCRGAIELDEFGRVIKCGSKYYSYERSFNQKERKLKWTEKVAQFIINAQGYLLWGVIICIVLSLSGFGWVIGAIFNGIRGTGRVAKDLVSGINKGKKYIRQNGYKYSESERQAYQQALDDMLSNIDNSLSSKKSKKIVNKLRADVKE